MFPERKSKRLNGWDYSSSGLYFITICCNNRQTVLGKICQNEVILSDIGNKAKEYWLEIPLHFPHVKLDEFIIMPNHIHGLLILDYSTHSPDHDRIYHKVNKNQFSHSVKNSISVIINQYKSSLKRWCNQNGFDLFNLQGRFYDQILRDDTALEKTRAYILNNPKNWMNDELYK